MEKDPRKLGGDIVGPGEDVLLDVRNAVILSSVTTTVVKTGLNGVMDEEPRVAMLLGGRINKTEDYAQVLYMMPVEGAASIIADLLGLARRLGPSYLSQVLEQVDELVKEGEV